MSSQASPTSSARPLQLRRRRDLITKPVQFRGKRYWSVKDPLTLRYYQLCDEELFVLEQVDGETSLAAIRRHFETRFAPRKLEFRELHAFLGSLHRAGLLTSRVAGQADELLERHERSRRQAKLHALTNLLAIRFRGIDPEPVLRVLYPNVQWMFSRIALFTSLVVILGALLSLVVHAENFVARLPRLETFLSLENVALLAVVLACCKVLHELGHALTCRHFGGHCHELGVMLLVFTPCLYCNVSDAWMLRSKWRRIAISAAGIYVELVLASVCTFLWWFSQTGVWNSVFLNVMFVCSVSTLLLNGNPLLRYDGYFILADLIELPNLRQQSQAFLQQLVAKCFGITPRQTWTLPHQHRAVLALYGIASLVYRWILVAGILFMIHRAWEPHRLAIIAQLLAVFVLGGMLVAPLWQMIQLVQEPHKGGRQRGWRMVLAGAAGVGGVILLGLIPASRHVTTPVVIEPAVASRLHVMVPGTLAQIAIVGQRVDAGGVVARLTDFELERALARLQGQRDVHKLYVEQLAKLQVLERGTANDGAGSQIVTAKEALAAIERQIDQKFRDRARLTITAPRTGIVLADRAKRLRQVNDQLPIWSGTPLDRRNLGCYLDVDTVVCLIGDPAELKGVALIDHSSIERVEIGQPARILVDELHEQVLTGTVAEIARVEAEQVPPELIAKQLLPADASATAGATYAIRIELSAGQKMPLLWSSGKAKIAVKPITLAEVIYRQLCNTFRIDL